MGKSSHFSGQPLYGQVIKLLDKSKILEISREKAWETILESASEAAPYPSLFD